MYQFLCSLGLTVSLGMLLWSSWLVARQVGNSLGDRFFAACLTAGLQTGFVALLLSLFHGLSWPAWLGLQSVLTLLVFVGLRYVRGRNGLFPVAVEGDDMPADAGPGDTLLFWGALGLTILLVVCSWILRVGSPLLDFDARMYHASRVAYWLQHNDILPYVTHNDRQNVFGFGSDIVFLYPLVFVKSELLGLGFFWLGLPLATLALFWVSRAAGLSRGIAALASLAYVGTPMVFAQSFEGLAPELWLSVAVLGVSYWVLRAWRLQMHCLRFLALAGTFAGLAISVKFTALALLPGLLLAAMFVAGARWLRAQLWIGIGLLSGLVFSGVILPLVGNTLRDGHPLGPLEMRKVHQAEASLKTLRTHVLRGGFMLFDPPIVPGDSLLAELQSQTKAFVGKSEASVVLRGEHPDGWPKPFSVTVGTYATRFSLVGMFWGPALLLATLGFLLGFVRARGPSLSPAGVLLLLQAPLCVGILFSMRWQGDCLVQARFFVSAYALGVVLCATGLQMLRARARWAFGPCVLIVTLALMPCLAYANKAWLGIPKQLPIEALDEPFALALTKIPDGARILVVANQDVRDYCLFRPRKGFPNKVFSWGKERFDPVRFSDIVRREQITHVLLQDATTLFYEWDPVLDARPMVDWLASNASYRGVSLPGSSSRLFEVLDSGRSAGK